MSVERCKHGLAMASCSTCASPGAIRLTPPLSRSSSGGISEVYRGFTIYFNPAPEREWSFRPASDAPLQSYRSAFQARRAINELLDGTSESTPRRDSRATSLPKAAPTPMADGFGSTWSDSELEASIAAYRRMLDAEHRGQPLTKRDIVESLMQVTGRTKGSIEMRLQNISAVLDERGLPWIDGYKPLSHYPERLKQLIERDLPE